MSWENWAHSYFQTFKWKGNTLQERFGFQQKHSAEHANFQLSDLENQGNFEENQFTLIIFIDILSSQIIDKFCSASLKILLKTAHNLMHSRQKWKGISCSLHCLSPWFSYVLCLLNFHCTIP